MPKILRAIHQPALPLAVFLTVAAAHFAAAQGLVGPVTINAVPPPPPPGITVVLQGLGGNCLSVIQTNPPTPQDSNGCQYPFGSNAYAAYASFMTFQLNDNGTIVNNWGNCLDLPLGYWVQYLMDGFAPLFFDSCNGTPGQIWEMKGQ